MAKIKIKGRIEAIELDNARAQKIKDRKFGDNGVEKADPQDLVDLGDWSGEYSRIVEIDMDKDERTRVDPQEQQRIEEKEADERWEKMSPEAKGKSTGWFGLAYSANIGDFSARPSEDLLKKVQKAQAEYYKKNPKVRKMPTEAYGDLLPSKKNKAGIAEKMSVDEIKENDSKCENIKCGIELKGGLSRFCSGKCMLIVQNGDLSTD